jgi:hypothetical protein
MSAMRRVSINVSALATALILESMSAFGRKRSFEDLHENFRIKHEIVIDINSMSALHPHITSSFVPVADIFLSAGYSSGEVHPR